MAGLTDEEVFGVAGAGPASSQGLSDDELFGGSSLLRTTSPQQTSSSPPTGLTDEQVFGTAPVVEPQRPGLLDYPVEAGRSFIRGGMEGLASSLKGAGAQQAALEPVMGQSLSESVLGAAVQGRLPEVIQAPGTGEVKSPTTTGLYQAGEAVSAAAPQDRGILNPVVRDVAAGFGSVAGNIAPALIPGVGIPLAVLMAGSQGMGEAAERAVKAGATPEQISRASRFGTIAGATEFADVALPFLGGPGKLAGLIGKVGSRILQGAFIEGGQEGLQQYIQNLIAQGIYKPDQDLGEDVPYNALIGAIVGGVTSGALGRRGPQTAPQAAVEAARAVIQNAAEAPLRQAQTDLQNAGITDLALGLTTGVPQLEFTAQMDPPATPPSVPVPDQPAGGINPALGPQDEWLLIQNQLQQERLKRQLSEGLPPVPELLDPNSRLVEIEPGTNVSGLPHSYVENLTTDLHILTPENAFRGREIQQMHAATVRSWLSQARALHHPTDEAASAVRTAMLQRFSEVVGDVPVFVVPDAEMLRVFRAPYAGIHTWTSSSDGTNFRQRLFLPYSTIRHGTDDPDYLVNTLVHEVAHAATVRAMVFDQDLDDVVSVLMKDVQGQITPDMLDNFSIGERQAYINYAFKNTKEFMAQALSNPQFQHVLASIYVSPAAQKVLGLNEVLGGQRPTFWQALIEIVRRVLALPQNPEVLNALEASLRLGSRIIDIQAQIPGDPTRPDTFGLGLGTNQAALRSEGTNPDLAVPRQPELVGMNGALSRLWGGSQPPPVKQASAHADRMHWGYRWLAGLDQLGRANPLFSPLIRYIEGVRAMHLEETQIQDAAVQISKQWRKLGPEEDRFAQFLLEWSTMAYRSPQEVANGINRHPTPAELQALFTKHNISATPTGRRPAGQKVFADIQTLLNGFMQLVEANAIARVRRSAAYQGNPPKLQARIAEIQAHGILIRQRPYFPFMNFGDRYIVVRDPNGATIHVETVERRGFRSAKTIQEQRMEEMRQKYQRLYGRAPIEVGQNAELKGGDISGSIQPLVGLPPLLLDEMKNTMKLDADQLNDINTIQFAHGLGLTPILHPQFQRKYYVPRYSITVPGFSMDLRRSFAKYMFHGSKFYARLKYEDQLRVLVDEAKRLGDVKANQIGQYMQDHLNKTVLDPRGDFGYFKGAIFVWAMGYVPAAATQNLSQIPMITYPWLNIIGATTPEWIQDNFPASMLSQGIGSRIVFVYGETKRHLTAYPSRAQRPQDYQDTFRRLVEDLTEVSKLIGAYELTDEAYQWGEQWYKGHHAGRSIHMASGRYGGYLARKQTHMHKLAMILSACQRDALLIEKEDLEMAEKILEGAEHSMIRVFESVGIVDEAKHIAELVAFVRAYSFISIHDLRRLSYNIMSERDFKQAIKLAVEGELLEAVTQNNKRGLRPKAKTTTH